MESNKEKKKTSEIIANILGVALIGLLLFIAFTLRTDLDYYKSPDYVVATIKKEKVSSLKIQSALTSGEEVRIEERVKNENGNYRNVVRVIARKDKSGFLLITLLDNRKSKILRTKNLPKLTGMMSKISPLQYWVIRK